MNNHLIGFSVSALLHGGVAFLVLGFAPLPPPVQKAVPLTLAMFEATPAVVQPTPKSVAVPARQPAPKRTVRKPKAEPPKPAPKPALPRLEPAPPPEEPPPPVALAAEPVVTAPAAAPPDPNAMASYADRLASLLARHRSYPRQAQLRGWQGQVELQLHIAPDGRLVDAQVSRSSGFEPLDRQALKMARLARPLPQPPEALRSKEFTVLVPVVFRLGS